ncbi:MAG: dual CXXC motif small (seleno)protein [Thermodesulfobacteriota bacterium]
MRCRGCGAEFPLERITEWFDQELEDELADIPCDRL